MTDLLSSLRHATNELHQALHVHPIMQSCQAGTLSKPEYIHMLKAFHSPLKQLSDVITMVPEALRPKLAARAKAIQDDLVELGVDLNQLAHPSHRPTLTSDEAMGMCYVLIGSSMGAGMLVERIKSALGDIPHSYFSMSPKEAGWPELMTHIRPLLADDHPSTTGAAHDTFKIIQLQLDKEFLRIP